MRKIIVSDLMSLDGYIAGPNNEIDWFVYEQEFGNYVHELMSQVGAILYGRVTYEWNSQYWPTATNNDPFVIEKMNALPKYVFSTTLAKVSWGKYENAHLIKTNVESEVRKLKQQQGKDMVIFGSGALISSFLKMGLIDELRTFVQPVILGRGLQLFRNLNERYKLNLVSSTPMNSGVVKLVYESQSSK
jgi:dihydrofolate reductase